MEKRSAKVLITGGEMEGNEGVVRDWIDGLHYQMVSFGVLAHRNIGADWIKVKERVHTTDDQELFLRWFPECGNLFKHVRIRKIELQAIPNEDDSGNGTFIFSYEPQPG